MQCENCNIIHNGEYGSGRFCTKRCARGFSSKAKRKEINEKVSKALTGRTTSKRGIPSKPWSDERRQRHKDAMQQYFASLELDDELTRKAKYRARIVANVLAYKARKRNAIIDDTDLSLIRKIYENCPKGYHVDHIIALSRGGLHHQDNLQYLPILKKN
jgi:hypothetical protein